MPATDRLSSTLRQLRRRAGLSGQEAAARAGMTQSALSRVETARYLPKVEYVEALCRVYGADPQTRQELVAMARDMRDEATSAQVVLETGGWWFQERVGRIEAHAGRIRELAPTVVPGIVQTRDYATALFGASMSSDDIHRTVEARLARQQLLDSEREFTIVLTEGALRWHMGGPQTMTEQLDRLEADSDRDNVQLGVIPWTTPVTVPLLHAVTIYDERAVMIGTQTGTALITDPDDLDLFEGHWKEVEQFASYGEAAREVLRRIVSEYRSLL